MVRELNKKIHKDLSSLVIERFLAKDGAAQELKVGELELNNFSVSFGIDSKKTAGNRGVYVKIPKSALFKERVKSILPLTAKDLNMAEEEYKSLIELSRFWPAEKYGIEFVKPLGFLKTYNAIITERFYAKDFFKLFRKADFARKIRIAKLNDRAHSVLRRIGSALSEFHQHYAKEGVFETAKTLEKIDKYSQELKSLGFEPGFCDKICSTLKNSLENNIESRFVSSLKGLDIRNFFTGKNGRIFILDPGKLKQEIPEADLARFLVTCRILYWGGVLFFLRFSPDISYEESFLEGYYGKKQKQDQLLSLFTIKELLKHWCLAHTVLDLKTWGAPLKQLLKKTYINPFYSHQISKEIGKWTTKKIPD